MLIGGKDLQALQGTERHPQRLPLVLGLPAYCLLPKLCPGASSPPLTLGQPRRGAPLGESEPFSSKAASQRGAYCVVGDHTTQEVQPLFREFYWNVYWCQKIKPTQTNWVYLTRSRVSCSRSRAWTDLTGAPMPSQPKRELSPWPDSSSPAMAGWAGRGDAPGEGMPHSSLSSSSPRGCVSRGARGGTRAARSTAEDFSCHKIVSRADYQKCLL